jgi:putative PIN family toxin of toxin-antitoxin system
MRYRVFLDTNVFISGIFFEGNEAKILDMTEIDLITSEDVVKELRQVTVKKLRYLGERPLAVALSELERALSDVEVVQRAKYLKKMRFAEQLIKHKKDIPILAAVLTVAPDYFITGDSHFFTEKIRNVVNVRSAKEFLAKM